MKKVRNTFFIKFYSKYSRSLTIASLVFQYIVCLFLFHFRFNVFDLERKSQFSYMPRKNPLINENSRLDLISTLLILLIPHKYDQNRKKE